MTNSCGWIHAEAQSGRLTGNPAPAIDVGQPDRLARLRVPVRSARSDPEMVGLSFCKCYLTAMQRTGASHCLIGRREKQVWRRDVSVAVGAFWTVGTEDQEARPVHGSATPALISIQASTRVQTVIHAAPRQRDVKKQISHLQASLVHTHTHT